MISHLKFNELENRVDLLVNRVLELEQQVRTLTESQGGRYSSRYGSGRHAGG